MQLAFIPIVMLYENIFEWLAHKYLLHHLGRNRSSFWSFHWIDHHNNARKNNFIDPDYLTWQWKWNARAKEILSLIMSAVVHSPMIYFYPLGYAVLGGCAIWYYSVHSKSHRDPEWCKKYLPWHYDHHMNPNQNANWCVTFPFSDWIFKSRVKV